MSALSCAPTPRPSTPCGKPPRAIPAEPPQRLALFSVTETLDDLGTAFRHHHLDAPYRGLWANTPRRQERAVLEGHTGGVYGVYGVYAVRVAGRELLASASSDRTVRLWDPATGHALGVIPVHYAALGLTSFDNNRLAVGLSAGLLALSVT